MSTFFWIYHLLLLAIGIRTVYVYHYFIKIQKAQVAVLEDWVHSDNWHRTCAYTLPDFTRFIFSLKSPRPEKLLPEDVYKTLKPYLK